MADWYRFKDPRHFYYGAYTKPRAPSSRRVSTSSSSSPRSASCSAGLDGATRKSLQQVLVPLRHYEWGANMNNGYCLRLRLRHRGDAGVQVRGDGPARHRAAAVAHRAAARRQMPATSLEAAKARDGSTTPAWQGVRRVMENLFVTQGLVRAFRCAEPRVSTACCTHWSIATTRRPWKPEKRPGDVAMLTGFITDWYDEIVALGRRDGEDRGRRIRPGQCGSGSRSGIARTATEMVRAEIEPLACAGRSGTTPAPTALARRRAASSMRAPHGSASRFESETPMTPPTLPPARRSSSRCRPPTTARSIVDAIVADNPHASVAEYPAMVKIDAPGPHRRQARFGRAAARPPLGRAGAAPRPDFPVRKHRRDRRRVLSSNGDTA